MAMGMTMSAATMLWRALKTIFSAATAATGMGHITLSSISRVMPNSVESGRATAAMPLNMMATAMRPGRRTVPKPGPAAEAMGLPPAMRGMMKVKTKRKSRGCMPTRSRNGPSSRLSTRRSRRSSPRKALTKRERSEIGLGLFTQVSPGELDEDGFEAWLVDGDVAQAKAGGGLDEFGQEAFGTGGEEAQAVVESFDVVDSGAGGEFRGERREPIRLADGELDGGLRAEGLLELLGRAKGEQASVIDDGNAVAEGVGLLHVMRGEDDGDAVLAEALNGGPHGEAALRIEAGAGFVEEEHGGPVSDGAGNLDALSKAAGELRRVGFATLCEQELPEQLVAALPCLSVAEAEVTAVVVEVFVDGERAVEGVVLGYDADVASRVSGLIDDIDASDAYFAGGGQGARGGDTDSGGFTGSVGSKEAEYLTFPDLKVNAIDRNDALFAFINLGQGFNFNNHSGEILGQIGRVF
uniref:Uncharacterized protein n=1 Tax=mine drainage metagenome TaxID=410659 RepID=E6QLA4_9ZZZZ